MNCKMPVIWFETIMKSEIPDEELEDDEQDIFVSLDVIVVKPVDNTLVNCCCKRRGMIFSKSDFFSFLT